MTAYHKDKNSTKFKGALFFLGVVAGDGGRIPSGFFIPFEIELFDSGLVVKWAFPL